MTSIAATDESFMSMPVKDYSPRDEWNFVNISTPSQKKDAANRKLVRGQAMRDFRRRQRQKQIISHELVKVRQEQETTPATTTTIAPDTSHTDDQEQEAEPLPLITSSACMEPVMNLRTLLDACTSDPFSVYPVCNDSRGQRLLSHFITALCPAVLPIDRTRGVNPLKTILVKHALTEPVLFHAVLFAAAVHEDALLCRKTNFETLRQRGEMIRLINLAMGSPNSSMSDATIAAVVLTSANEIMAGNFRAMGIHMNAVEKMVRLRGGLTALGLNSVLHMMVSWQDLLYATTTLTTPRFAPTPAVTTLLSSTTLIERFLTPSYTPHLATLPTADEFPGICDAQLPVFHDLRTITLILDSAAQRGGTTPIEMMSFSRMRSAIEYSLLSMPVRDGAGYELARTSAHIYINLVLREFRPNFAVLRTLKRRLRGQIGFLALDDDAEKVARYKPKEVLLWSLCVGALLALDEEEKGWWRERIRVVQGVLGIWSWEELEAELFRLLWTKEMSVGLERVFRGEG